LIFSDFLGVKNLNFICELCKFVLQKFFEKTNKKGRLIMEVKNLDIQIDPELIKVEAPKRGRGEGKGGYIVMTRGQEELLRKFLKMLGYGNVTLQPNGAAAIVLRCLAYLAFKKITASEIDEFAEKIYQVAKQAAEQKAAEQSSGNGS
jgi:hypothetical protein